MKVLRFSLVVFVAMFLAVVLALGAVTGIDRGLALFGCESCLGFTLSFIVAAVTGLIIGFIVGLVIMQLTSDWIEGY